MEIINLKKKRLELTREIDTLNQSFYLCDCPFRENKTPDHTKVYFYTCNNSRHRDQYVSTPICQLEVCPL